MGFPLSGWKGVCSEGFGAAITSYRRLKGKTLRKSAQSTVRKVRRGETGACIEIVDGRQWQKTKVRECLKWKHANARTGEDRELEMMLHIAGRS